MFRDIELEDIIYPQHREILSDLISRLQDDLKRRVELGVSCISKNTYGWSSMPKESWVVCPNYIVRDSKRDLISKPKIFIAGDGNIGGFLPGRILRLFGVIKELPWDYKNFGYTRLVNEEYFQVGSKAREVPFLKDYFNKDLRILIA